MLELSTVGSLIVYEILKVRDGAETEGLVGQFMMNAELTSNCGRAQSTICDEQS